MRRPGKLLLTLVLLTGCHHPYVPPESPLPPNTILLSQMMRRLSAQPGFTQTLLDRISASQHDGFLTPRLFNELRKRILGSDWQGLDRFPGWTMREINPTVDLATHFAPHDPNAALHFLDLGPYALKRAETISLDQPSTLPPFTPEVTNLGDGVLYGDGPNNLAPEHSDSQRLADLLNRLAANRLDGSKTLTAGFNGLTASTPEGLVQQLIATGASITVTDARYFANFGHLHYSAGGTGGQAKDVMMPFWIDSGLTIPHTHGRHLLIPAAHAELEWHIHLHPTLCGGICPHINADISYYFGIDGKSEWRTMDTLDQPWVLHRNAHTYTGAQAVEATRLAGLLTVAYMHLHATHPTLPFGGYYTLGVCQDGVSAIEHKLTGHVTLFPNTADDALFTDPRDAEANAMIRAIPKDRNGTPPTPGRIFGSLPTAPAADPNQAFNAITIPGLAADLNAVWKANHP